MFWQISHCPMPGWHAAVAGGGGGNALQRAAGTAAPNTLHTTLCDTTPVHSPFRALQWVVFAAPIVHSAADVAHGATLQTRDVCSATLGPWRVLQR